MHAYVATSSYVNMPSMRIVPDSRHLPPLILGLSKDEGRRGVFFWKTTPCIVMKYRTWVSARDLLGPQSQFLRGRHVAKIVDSEVLSRFGGAVIPVKPGSLN